MLKMTHNYLKTARIYLDAAERQTNPDMARQQVAFAIECLRAADHEVRQELKALEHPHRGRALDVITIQEELDRR